MKKILLVALVSFTLFSCNKGITVSFDDPKSQAILSAYDSYMENDAAAIESLYSEDAVVFLNSLDSIPIQENVKNLAMHHELFDNISLSWGDGENERTAFVQTSSYPTIDVTLAWFTWTGTGKTTGEDYSNRGHFDYKWENGKIIELQAYYSESAETNEANAYAEAQK